MSSLYEIPCDGCEQKMIGSTDTVMPPYAVDVVTFTKHEYYCSTCWQLMKTELRQALIRRRVRSRVTRERIEQR